MEKAQSNKRRQKFVRPDLQVKVIVIAFAVSAFVAVFNSQLDFMTLWGAGAEAGKAEVQFLEGLYSELIWNGAWSLVVALTVAVCVGIVFSFTSAGPVHRLKLYLEELQAGRWTQDLRLRDKDEMTDIRDSLNSVMAAVRERARDSHAFHQEVKALIENGDIDGDACERLKASIQSEEEFFAQRFGGEEQCAVETRAHAEELAPQS